MDGIPVERVDQPLQASTGQLIVPERLDEIRRKGLPKTKAVDAYRKSLVLFAAVVITKAIQDFRLTSEFRGPRLGGIRPVLHRALLLQAKGIETGPDRVSPRFDVL